MLPDALPKSEEDIFAESQCVVSTSSAFLAAHHRFVHAFFVYPGGYPESARSAILVLCHIMLDPTSDIRTNTFSVDRRPRSGAQARYTLARMLHYWSDEE